MGDVEITRVGMQAIGTRLLASASVLVLGMLGAAAPAFAQDAAAETTATTAATAAQAQEQDEAGNQAPPETGAPETEEVANADEAIIVTGIRQSLRSARNIKKNAEQIGDSITAQDIGALPDRSVSEALQRIPGVTLQRTNAARDPARLAAEGGGIFVRGLSWVRSELNGRDVFSANSGRSLSFEDVSSDLLAGVDVWKNPSADMVEGGIGGIVDLRTRKPFDQPGQVIAASIDYNYADLRKKGFWSGSALYSNRWDTGIGEIGILLSASLGHIGNRTDSVQTGDYTGRDVTGDAVADVFVPITLGFRRIDWEQKRTAFAGSIQWRPTPDLLITAEALRAKATPEDIEFNVGDYFSPLPSSDPSYVFDDDGILQSGTVSGRLLDNNTRYGKRVNKTNDYSLNARFTPTDRWTLSADVQRVKSSMDLESMTVFAQPENPFTVEFDLSGDTPVLHYTSPSDTQGDPSTYWWAAAMDHHEKNEADQWAYRADAEYEFENPFLKSFRFGARATDRSAISRSTSWNWSILSRQHWGGGPPVYLTDQGTPPNPGLPDQTTLLTFSNFFRGDIAAPGGFWFPSADLVSNGTANAFSYLQSTLSGGWGWSPLADDAWATVNDQSEKTLAGYGLLRFAMDDGPLGRMDGNIGVRVVQTKNAADDPLVPPPGTVNAPPLATCLAAATAQSLPASVCDPLESFLAFRGAGFGDLSSQLETDNKYTDILPSLNLRFFLRDDLQLRLAAGKAISRPSFAQLLPVTNISFNFDALTGFPTGIDPATGQFPSPFRGTGANPTLRPIKSTQFDASLEYYFGDSGQLSAAIFYKRVKDFIFAGVERVPFTSNGETIEFELVTLMNGSKGTVKGAEFAYQQFYDFLPGPLSGIGLQANFTYIDAKGGRNTTDAPGDPNQVGGSTDLSLPLEGMSKYAYNIALMYAKYGIDARLAYNWRSRYLLTSSAANINRPVWADDYGQLDGSILYSVTKNVKLGVQGTNLLNSKTFLEVGDAFRTPRYSWTITDRRIAVLLRTQF